MLDTRTDDRTLDEKGETATFACHTPTGQKFRIFRVRQTGRNSNNHFYLALSGFEIFGETFAENTRPSTEPDPVASFVHTAPFDGNGLVHHLTTNGGTRGYLNPATTGLARVTSSAMMADSEPATAVLGDAAVRCVTRPVSNAWIAIEFPGIRLRPDHYSLRHYDSWDTEALRSWRLEGSNDGTQWTPLRSHFDDRALTTRGATASWEINGLSPEAAFSHFRIIQTGPNSNNHLYLALSGFEIYGSVAPDESLIPDIAAPAGNPGPLTLTYETEMEGVIHYLATNNGTRPHVNPVNEGIMGASASSLIADSVPVSAIAGPDVVRCVTKPIRNSWMQIDFMSRTVRPTHYSLRHYSSWDTEALRSWVLEASNDGDNWTDLSTHEDDRSLDRRGAVHTWPLPGVRQAYRFFRVRQTGRNSNNHHYLALSGMEFYGDLFDDDFSPNTAYNQWALENGLPPGNGQKMTSDRNNDGTSNFGHFVYGTSPTAAGPPRIPTKTALVMLESGGTDEFLSLTLPVRGNAPLMNGTIDGDGVTYRIHTSINLRADANLPLREVVPARAAGLRLLPPGYRWRTFELSSSTKVTPQASLWLEASP